MRKFFKILFKTVKWGFIVFCLFIGSLFFREQRIPNGCAAALLARLMPKDIVVCADSISFGFVRGLHVRGLRAYPQSDASDLAPIFSASSLSVSFIHRRVIIEELLYSRLPDSYYEPGNFEKSAPVDVRFPQLGRMEIVLIRPNILSVSPESVVADLVVDSDRLSFERAHLIWPDADERMVIDGNGVLDLRLQRLSGEIHGSAMQRHIRPLIETLDVPVALPYFDGFTDVVGKVPASCSWDVNLVNNDADIVIELSPKMGKYNSIPMDSAEGRIHLHIETRGESLNYTHVIGPVHAQDAAHRTLDGSVSIKGLNGTNTISVVAKSQLPVASLLKIGGFTGEYVDSNVVGNASGELEFVFPRAMTNNYEVLQGRGNLSIRDGQIMRLRGFQGLLSLLADKVPGVSWFTDSTQASCSYVIENGVLKSDDIYIEGTVFSIKMAGTYDCTKDMMDFIVRVQFSKKESVVGKVIHPLTWPFTKLLLEFRLTGSVEEPKWSYLSVIDRVLEVTK